MTEIVKDNFEANLPTLEASLKSAIFVSIDALHTGSMPVKGDQTSETYYSNAKNCVQDCRIVQLGIAAFQFDETTNSYFADVFSVYLNPVTLEVGNNTFLASASGFKILSCRRFDFKKVFQNGLSYVDGYKAAYLNDHSTAGEVLYSLYELSEFDLRTKMKLDIFSKVNKWLETAEIGQEMIITCPSYVQSFIIEHRLRTYKDYFPRIWTEKLDNQQIRVMRVSPEARADFDKNLGNGAIEKEAIQYCLGFSRVLFLLYDLKIPIVGHSVLVNLMLSFQQFYEPLPDSFEKFNIKLKTLQISIYDTKLICNELRRKFSSVDFIIWDENLPNVFEFVKSQSCEILAYNLPRINAPTYCRCDNGSSGDASGKRLTNHFNSKHDCRVHTVQPIVEFHGSQNAGLKSNKHDTSSAWNAFMAGFVFLRLAHIQTYQQKLQEKEKENWDKPHQLETWNDLFESVKPYENIIHSSGKSPDMDLKISNDQSYMPPLLYVQMRDNSNINMQVLQKIFARFDNIKLMPFTGTIAVLQAPTHVYVTYIVDAMKMHQTVRVKLYDPILHSSKMPFIVGTTSLLLIIGGLTLLALTWNK